MKIISWNVNGIRACANKGFLEFLNQESPDILCIQESKAQVQDLAEHILMPSGYHGIWHSAERKGYSGTAILTKIKPKHVLEGFGNPKYDCEGRVVMAEYDDFVVFSVYFPNGQQGEERICYKLEFYHDFFNFCEEMRQNGKSLIICGDYNTAHTEIDLANPKENTNTSGFMPIEREWIDKICRMGYIDTFRQFNKEPENYSWWSYRTRARDRNVGWRIDYCFVTEDLMPRVTDAFILQDILGSDHCPVGINLNA